MRRRAARSRCRKAASPRRRLHPTSDAERTVLAKYFIERPVLANVIALLAIVIGAVALLYLPVAQFPPITPPTVQVAARYPGANAQTVVDTVALPIEQQVNGVEKMLYMQSTAANDGTYSLVVTFAVGTDLDQAQVQVQNRISAALAQLPEGLEPAWRRRGSAHDLQGAPIGARHHAGGERHRHSAAAHPGSRPR